MSSETTDLGRRETSTGENASKGRASLKPLLALKPLMLAHKGALWGAAIAVVMSAVAMLDEIRAGIPSHATGDIAGKPAMSGDEIRERMSGNLCRCGAYSNIVEAIAEVAARRKA